MIRNKKNGMRAWQRGLLLLGAALGIALVAACGEQRFDAHEAKAFTLPLLNSTDSLSLDDYRGDVVYLTFWASWCEPCRQEMPYLAQLWQRHREAGLQVIGINVEEDISAARQFAEDHDLPFPLVQDTGRMVSKLYRVPGFPTHFIIDRRGRIRFSGLSFNLADVAAVSQEVETLLRESVDAAD